MKNAFGILFIGTLLAACSTPIAATSNRVGNLEGHSCSRNILFIFPISSDESIYSAAVKGGIGQISTVDRDTITTLIYNSSCTIVHGSK